MREYIFWNKTLSSEKKMALWNGGHLDTALKGASRGINTKTRHKLWPLMEYGEQNHAMKIIQNTWAFFEWIRDR